MIMFKAAYQRVVGGTNDAATPQPTTNYGSTTAADLQNDAQNYAEMAKMLKEKTKKKLHGRREADDDDDIIPESI